MRYCNRGSHFHGLILLSVSVFRLVKIFPFYTNCIWLKIKQKIIFDKYDYVYFNIKKNQGWCVHLENKFKDISRTFQQILRPKKTRSFSLFCITCYFVKNLYPDRCEKSKTERKKLLNSIIFREKMSRKTYIDDTYQVPMQSEY